MKINLKRPSVVITKLKKDADIFLSGRLKEIKEIMNKPVPVMGVSWSRSGEIDDFTIELGGEWITVGRHEAEFRLEIEI